MRLFAPIKEISPIAWVGGKWYSTKRITGFIPEDISDIVSPFAGGLKVELRLAASRGVGIHCGDKHSELCNFYNCARDDHSTVLDYASAMHPFVDYDNWARFRDADIHDKYVRAAKFFILNRLSFGGDSHSSGAGCIAGNRPRLIRLIAKIRKHPELLQYIVTCHNQDWSDTLDRHPHIFAYLDPPWPGCKKGQYDHVMDYAQHDRLYQALRRRNSRWALSYPGNAEIRHRYSDFRVIDIPVKYPLKGQGTHDLTTDVLILNY